MNDFDDDLTEADFNDKPVPVDRDTMTNRPIYADEDGRDRHNSEQGVTVDRLVRCADILETEVRPRLQQFIKDYLKEIGMPMTRSCANTLDKLDYVITELRKL